MYQISTAEFQSNYLKSAIHFKDGSANKETAIITARRRTTQIFIDIQGCVDM